MTLRQQNARGMNDGVVFDFILEETPLHLKVAESLLKDGHKVCGVCVGARYKRLLSTSPVPVLNFDIVFNRIMEKAARLHSYEKRAARTLQNSGVDYKAIYGDRNLRSRDLRFGLLFCYAWLAALRFLRSLGYRSFVGPEACFAHHIVAIQSHPTTSMRYVGFTTNRWGGDKLGFSDNLHQDYLVGTAQASSKGGQPLYINLEYSKRFVNSSKLKEFARRCAEYFPRSLYPADIYSRNPLEKAFTECALAATNALSRAFPTRRPRMPNAQFDCDFFLLPLHYEPESATLIFGYEMESQDDFAVRVAKHLPLGAKLVVKEHPIFIGRRTRSFKKNLKKANIEYLDYHISAEMLIRSSFCRGVISISSTLGFEAAQEGVPVYLFGEAFYKNLPLVTRIRSLGDLELALQNSPRPAASEGTATTVSETPFSMNAYYYIPHAAPFVMHEDNVASIAEIVKNIVSSRSLPS